MKRPIRRSSPAPRDLHGAEHVVFLSELHRAELPMPVPEFRFAAPRKWRFDYAWADPMMDERWCRLVALEVEGGAYSRGRHTRGEGFIKDMEKYSEAAVRGWCVIRVTPQQLPTTYCLNLIRRALER